MDMPLLERDAEIAAIEQLVGIGGVLVLEGPAGIGKTFLLAETVRRADCGRAARPPRSGE